MTEVAKEWRNYVAIEQFYVTIELARVGRVSVVTDDFSIATEMATTEALCLL